MYYNVLKNMKPLVSMNLISLLYWHYTTMVIKLLKMMFVLFNFI